MIAVGVEDLHFGNQPAALQGVGRAGADPAAAANDGHFHEVAPGFSFDMI
jgi:hypothetical protein